MTNTPEIDDLIGPIPSPENLFEGSGDELARWLGLSARQVSRLAKDGRAVRLGRNRFDLQASVRAYSEWMRDQMPAGKPTIGDSRTRLADERQRLVREQADAVALKNAQSRCELVQADDVERAWSGVLRGVRAAMLALPSRVQSRLAHLTSDDVAAIEREVRDALSETANGDSHDEL